MTNFTRRWQICPPIPAYAEEVLNKYHPVLRQILYNRGYVTSESAQRYLEARPPEGTDPFGLLGLNVAVDRLLQGIGQFEPIAIYGDYDVDGVTATALLVNILKGLGANVIGYIPNRFDEGYGLNKEALDTLKEQGIHLVITVDCGIRSPEEAAYARDLDIDLIITDHHHPAGKLPQALAIINPKQPGDTYPDKDLAGVGLAYKLAEGLLTSMRKGGLPIPANVNHEDTLDLVALGTVADLAPMTGENRTLVRAGLMLMHKPHRQGLSALIGASGLVPGKISAMDIGFILGPRLNAAGRLDTAQDALTLLTTDDFQVAGRLAQQLDNQNRERQKITREIREQAEQLVLTDGKLPFLIFAAHKDFNAGVVGLAASRLAEQYYRPAIVARINGETTRGSCRSIPEFHITDALDQCADLLVQHGGHAAAAGFTVRNDHLEELILRLQKIAADQLSHYDLRPVLTADAVVELADLDLQLLKSLDDLQPTGYGNQQALFVTRNLKVKYARPVGKDGIHLKLLVSDGWLDMDAIAFRLAQRVDRIPAKVDLIYTFELNEYNGRQSFQLNVRDIKPSGSID
jgi:single-stranded-DNA-specific exonuclease